MLQLMDVTFVVGGKGILQRLHPEVRAREIHSILGANGADKSTLAAVIMGLSGYRPTPGTILFQEEDITPPRYGASVLLITHNEAVAAVGSPSAEFECAEEQSPLG